MQGTQARQGRQLKTIPHAVNTVAGKMSRRQIVLTGLYIPRQAAHSDAELATKQDVATED
jgi:hypothetical protein